MAGIRVNTSIKRIEVNDNGEYIELNFGDISFPDRVFAMIDNAQRRAEDAQAQENEILEKYAEDEMAKTRAISALYRTVHEDIMREVDALFGPDTCRKVFGDIVPDIVAFGEFFDQLTPYISEFSKERIAKMSKYSAARTGNV